MNSPGYALAEVLGPDDRDEPVGIDKSISPAARSRKLRLQSGFGVVARECSMNPKVDDFLSKAEKWQAEFEKLRSIVLDCGLTEDFKWGHPCYTVEGGNVVLIHGFKDYCALLFFKGALLTDANGLLIQQTENVQGSRQIRFTSVREIDELEPIVKAYVRQAIDVEKAGLKVEYKETSAFAVSEEFQKKLDEDPALRAAFEALTPGRQRAYLLYFSAPKQSKTREARVEKSIDLILDGMGLHDQ